LKYRVDVQLSAAKALKKIPEPDRKRISKKIDSLAEQLPSHEETKMKGNNPFHQNRPQKRYLQEFILSPINGNPEIFATY
jgi:mRNA-degrading endonuclease RelE of RelBE toxin-antitoxin system